MTNFNYIVRYNTPLPLNTHINAGDVGIICNATETYINNKQNRGTGYTNAVPLFYFYNKSFLKRVRERLFYKKVFPAKIPTNHIPQNKKRTVKNRPFLNFG